MSIFDECGGRFIVWFQYRSNSRMPIQNLSRYILIEKEAIKLETLKLQAV